MTGRVSSGMPRDSHENDSFFTFDFVGFNGQTDVSLVSFFFPRDRRRVIGGHSRSRSSDKRKKKAGFALLSERDKHDSRVRQRRESRAPQASLATACGAARRFEHARTGTMSHVAAAAVPSATRVCAPRARNATAAAAGRPLSCRRARPRRVVRASPGYGRFLPARGDAAPRRRGGRGRGGRGGRVSRARADAFPRFEGVAGEDPAGAIEALKAADIKSELARFGANTAGAKALLVERLARCYELRAEARTRRSGGAARSTGSARRKRRRRSAAAPRAAGDAPAGIRRRRRRRQSRGRGL